MLPAAERLGVLLMTYGSPASIPDVGRYLTAVRGGRGVDPGLVAEFERRYRLIGGSPLVPITMAQAKALQEHLGDAVAVRAAMRFSEPTIASVVAELVTAGCGELLGIVLSPQFSSQLMGGYERALLAAVDALRTDAARPPVRIAGAWHLQPAFVGAMGARVREAIQARPAGERRDVPVLMTAHSLPQRVAQQEPGYLKQLADTAEAVASAAGIGIDRWRFCWQSAGHEPGAWMAPDFADLMPILATEGHRSVVVAPIQFLADHLETLYDVDIGAREQAEAQGLEMVRVRALNTDPGLIDALADVVRSERPHMEAARPVPRVC